MKKRSIIFALVLVILSSLIVLSHGDSEENVLNSSDLYPLSNWAVVGYGSLAFGLVIAYILLFNNKMSEIQKKAVFYLLILICMSVTIYLVVTTVHLNLVSESKGPVHWHADYELWVCDEELELYEPKGMSNMQGDGAFHSHDDNRLHVEGVIVDMKSARLSVFFNAIGGSLSDDGMEIPTDNGIIKVHDGDMCNNLPGKLYVFVNGNLTEHADDYVISPYEQVPPGDKIKFIFTEKPMEQINPNLK